MVDNDVSVVPANSTTNHLVFTTEDGEIMCAFFQDLIGGLRNITIYYERSGLSHKFTAIKRNEL